MPEPDPFTAWWSALASLPNKLPKSYGVPFGILISLLLAPLLVMLAYNALAPLFHAPSMTYAEAAGVVFFYGLLVATIAFLKE